MANGRLMLLYSRDASRPVARIEIGGPAKDGDGLYARLQGRETVMTVASAEVAHLSKLIALAGNAS